MFVEMPFEPIECRIQHRGGVEVPSIDCLGFDRASGPLDQPVGPGMIGLGRTMSDPATPAALSEWMNLGRAGSVPAPIASQREFPPVVGRHPIEAKRIEQLSVGQQGDRVGQVPLHLPRQRTAQTS